MAKRKSQIDVVVDECVAVRIRLLSRAITKVYNDALRPLGLNASQMNVLVATAKMGIGRPAEICKALQLEVSTLSRNVDRMKARGWLEVVEDSDARAQPFRLTTSGKELLDRAIPKWRVAQRRVKDALGEDTVNVLANACRNIFSL